MTGFTTEHWLKVLDEHQRSNDRNVARLSRMLKQAVEYALEGRSDKIIEMLDWEAADILEQRR